MGRLPFHRLASQENRKGRS